jgi:hypothetical protein
LIVFKLFVLYKVFFFSVFSKIIIENNEKAKYSTKNNSIYSVEVFFAPTNHISAINSSNRNFIPTATNVFMVCASGSRGIPLLKIDKDITAERAKEETRIITGIVFIPRLNAELATSVPHTNNRNSIRRGNKYFR